MANKFHKDLTASDLHLPYRWVFANDTARLAEVPTVFDLYKTAFVISTEKVYTLTDISPITWVQSSGTSDHGSLIGLSDDDHTQYTLASGARAFTGSIDLGGNNIINVNLVDGVDVTTHAARHLPDGADPLATAAGVSVGTTNSAGVANSLARSDHIHAHGNQIDPSLHAAASTIANGFMSSTDKTKLDAITGTNTGDQTITLTGDVTGSGTGSFAATIASHAVTNSKFRQSAGLSVVGVAGSATSDVSDIIGTANQILRVNAAGTTLAFGSIDISASVTGILPITNGGTGQSSANDALNALLPAQTGNSGKALVTDGTNTSWSAAASGTVTSVSVVTANGVSGSVATATTTPAITLTLGAITPSSVAAVGAVTGSNLSGTNTGDQTTITGNAGTATALQTARTINGVSFDGTANITITSAAGTLTGTTLNATVITSSLTSVGTLVNLTVTNPITGSITGSSGSTTGNAATATALQTPRNINGTSFDGTANITITAAAGTLTGTTLNSSVVSSSLTSVGTITSGTWNGTTIAAINGGTGQTVYAVGDLLYASTTTALSKLADVATGNALISGGVSTAPAWGKIGLTTHISGILPIANGGTGQSTANDALNALLPSQSGHAGEVLSTNGTNTSWSAAGSGSVTSVSVVTANGVSGSVATATTTPAITLTLGAITPSSVAATGTVTGSNLSGTNTGDQTSVTGNAGTATALQTPRTINGTSFDGTTNITVTAAAGTLTGTTLNSSVVTSSLTSVGTLTNLTVTNPITGSITGNAATVTTNANLTGPITSSGNATSVTANAITNAMLAQVSTATFKGRTTAGTGNVEDLTVSQANALLNTVASVSANTTLDSTHSIVLVDTSSASITITLPTAVSISGTRYTIKKTAANNIVVIDANGSQTIDGALTLIQIANNDWVIIVSDGANWKVLSKAGDSTIWDVNQSTDWTDGIITTALNFTENSTGTASTTVFLASESGHPGIVSISAGTTATGRSSLNFNGNLTQVLFGDGVRVFEAIVRFPTLSDGTVTYTAVAGWGDSNVETSAQVDGVYFVYEQTTSANWRCYTSNNSTRTATSSSVAVGSNTWHKLRIIVNAAGTSAAFYIDDMTTPAVTTTTNIPTAAGRESSAIFHIEKTVGAGGGSNRAMNIDKYVEQTKLTTPR